MPAPRGTLRNLWFVILRSEAFAATPTRNASSYMSASACPFLTASTPALGLETTWTAVSLQQVWIQPEEIAPDVDTIFLPFIQSLSLPAVTSFLTSNFPAAP